MDIPMADSGIFDRELKELRKRYPRQPPDTWIKVSVAMRPMFERLEPKRPAVLLLLTSEKESNTFPTALASALTRCWLMDNEDVPEFDNQFTTEDITSIYTRVENYAKTNHVIIFREMQKCDDPDYLKIFHNLCDNSYAPYKRMCYIFTMTLSENDIVAYLKSNPGQVEKGKTTLLNDAWSNVTQESRAALIARVSPFTNFILDENRYPESFVRVTSREAREAEQHNKIQNSWFSMASNCVEYVSSFMYSTRRYKFDELVGKMKNKYPSSEQRDRWDIFAKSFELLVDSKPVAPTVILFVLLNENSLKIFQNLTDQLELAFDIFGCTTKFDHTSFEETLGSMDTKLKNHSQDITCGHACKNLDRLLEPNVRKLLSIFPKENNGEFNNSYWLFTIAKPEDLSPSGNIADSVRGKLETCFGKLADYEEGAYLLERLLDSTIYL